jgi:hypothetical protein
MGIHILRVRVRCSCSAKTFFSFLGATHVSRSLLTPVTLHVLSEQGAESFCLLRLRWDTLRF